MNARFDDDFEFQEATVTSLQEAMEQGDFTSRELAQAYVTRIEALDRNGPALRSILEINPDWADIADALDDERRATGARGPLHGIPVLIKDNIDTDDRMATTAGSLALLDSRPQADASVARRLREAGAVILGKTNMSEWANFRSTRSSSGWSARGGQCRNPYILDRNPSGSSSGSAVAVATNLAAVALGTETDGSIVSPSHANGVVGIKPTVGLVSRVGVIPISDSQDTVGPMARTVRDAAILLGALVGVDPLDTVTATSAGLFSMDYTRFLDPDGLRGARIGVAREVYWGYSKEADAVAESAIETMVALGATVIDPADLPSAEEMKGDESELLVLLYEFKAGLNRYLAGRGPIAGRTDMPAVRSLADLIAFNNAHAAAELPYFGQELLLMAEEKGPLTDPSYLHALAQSRRLARTGGIDAVMDRLKLDALVAPTGQPAWQTDLQHGDSHVGGSSSPAAMAGYPLISVPAGSFLGLPVGITFMGRAYSEPTLIKLAYAFEQASAARRRPEFRATLDVPAE